MHLVMSAMTETQFGLAANDQPTTRIGYFPAPRVDTRSLFRRECLSIRRIMMRVLLLCFLLIFASSLALPQDRTNARSMVISPYGIVATSQVLASQAGAEILSHGGSAVDAAIAANATLGVMEPDMNGMGGDVRFK